MKIKITTQYASPPSNNPNLMVLIYNEKGDIKHRVQPGADGVLDLDDYK